jgi:serine/threonine protein kinase
MLPFNDYTITDILKNTMAGEYKFSDKRTLSAEAMDLVDQLLQNDPNGRISLEDAVKHPWFNILKEPRKKERRAAVRDKTKKF